MGKYLSKKSGKEGTRDRCRRPEDNIKFNLKLKCVNVSVCVCVRVCVFV